MNRARLLGIVLLAAAFGYVEAATVAHIRRAMHIPDGWDYPRDWARNGVSFNSASISAQMFYAIGAVELGREAATLLLLVGAAVAAGRTGMERLALFGLTFAGWDLTYYGWLRLFTGFPASLTDTDIYFLLPVPLYGPVLLPLLGMPLIAWASFVLLRREEDRIADLRPSPGNGGGAAVERG
jgi:hypothetical protein